jgi:hypothetical protein
MSCYKYRKAECDTADCEWIIGKGCKTKVATNVSKKTNAPKASNAPKAFNAPKASNAPKTSNAPKAPNAKKSLSFLQPSNKKALCKIYNIKSVDPVVWTEINRLFEQVCAKIFSKKITTKEFTIKDVDDQIFLENNDISKFFIKNAEMTTMKYLRGDFKSTCIYHPDLKIYMEQAYGIKFENEYVVFYILGGLELLFAEIVDICWKVTSNSNLTMDILLLSVNDDNVMNQFFDHVRFEFTEPDVPTLDHNRLPKVFYVTGSFQNASKRYAKTLIPGDILANGHQWIYIFDKNGAFSLLPFNKNDQYMIPPWVSELYISKGYTFDQVRMVYHQKLPDVIRFILLPESQQNGFLKMKKGVVLAIRGFELWMDDPQYVDSKELKWHSVNEEDKEYNKLFLGAYH